MNKKIHTQHSEGGYIVILNVLIFLAITFFVVTAAVFPLIASNNATKALLASTKTFAVTNSAIEETLYRLKNEFTLDTSEVLTLGVATATISVSSGLDEKTIRVEGVSDVFERDVELVTSKGAGVSFNYGMQVGRGGFQMAGGARVNGNVYGNGNITGSGGPVITGSAIVANQSSPVAHQTNGLVFPPVYDIDFGGNATPQDFAQSFTVSTTTPVTSVRLYMKRTTTGWMQDITVRLVEGDPSDPTKDDIDAVSLSASQIGTAYNYITIPFSEAHTLSSSETYWIVLDTSTTWGHYYSLGASLDTYGNGRGMLGTWSQGGSGGTWSETSPSGLDGYFDIYVGGETGLIDGITVGQDGGDAWAHEVQDSFIHGDLYCQASDDTNKPCDTSRPDPSEQPFPISDGNIDDWKLEAETGTTTVGNVNIGSGTVIVTGPRKIEGDLTVGSDGILELSGTLYVTGDIDVSGAGIIRLATSYGTDPGVLVSDGQVDISGGGEIIGNGFSGSYILVVTTSECPDAGSCSGNAAISLSGGTTSAVLNAQKGTLTLSGGANVTQATAHTISMSGGAIVNYETGLANVNFSSGPAGSWTIDSWQEI